MVMMGQIGALFGDGFVIVQSAIFLVFIGCLFAIAAFDTVTYTIPNSISVILIALFICMAVLTPRDISVLSHLSSFLIVFVVGLLAFHFRALGGGDVKSWAAIALWFDLGALPYQVAAVALIGGVFGIVVIGVRRVLASAIHRRGDNTMVLPKILMPNQPLPYGLAIGLGTALCLPGITLFRGVLY